MVEGRSRPQGLHRRRLLAQLVGLGVGAGAFLAVRREIAWPTPQVRFAGGRGSSGWLTLPMRGGLIALPAQVGGGWISAVVDSGAQYSAIDAGLARRLDLPPATAIPMLAFGVSGGPSLTHAVRLDVDLGALRLGGLRAATLDLASLSQLTRQPFSLLLGRDFLRAVIADADFPRGRVAFARPADWTPPAAAVPAAVRSVAGGLMVPVAVEGGPPVEVLLDTGATGALALSETAARAAGLLDGRQVRFGQSVTLGGVGQDRVVQARRLSFAGHVLHDVEVQVFTPAAHGPIPSGLVGLGVLKRFRTILDHAGGRLFLIESS
jgi:predicted aspartyl protease